MSEQTTWDRIMRRAARDICGDEEGWANSELLGMIVDAILAELREPDAAMVDAGLRDVVVVNRMHRIDCENAFRSGWRAAIDAVRGEGQDAVSRRSRAP